MKAMIESTGEITTVEGAHARIWNGTTPAGVRFVAYIVRVRVASEADQSEFARELIETVEPRR